MPAPVYPLIDPWSVFQTAMGVFDHERPLGTRSTVGCKAVVIAVYPVGHTNNHCGQTVVDVQPSNGLPLLYRVPLAHGHAHEETEEQAPFSERRNATAPKDRNRMQGSSFDVRPGTFVWVTFIGGSVYEPVITATIGFNQKQDKVKAEGTYSPSVDRIAKDGTLKPAATRPFDSGMGDYPRRVESYNGCRDEVDNTGSRYVHTSTDRKPVWKESNEIPESPKPQGNYGVSTRGAIVGNIRFTTGRGGDKEEHAGRLERVSMDADDGTIRDETASKIGNIIHHARGATAWTKGKSVYAEGDRAYVKLTGDADVHGDTAVLNAGTVKLGGPGMSDEVVLWPQLCEVLEAVFKIFDQHKHGGVESGESTTAIPDTPTQSFTFSGGKESFKAADVFAGQSASPSPKYQDDPDGDDRSGSKAV